MAKKRNARTSHFGMAGHLAAMSEFYLRGYNAAVPEVDVGDDIYVVNDATHRLVRVQVKTGDKSTNARADAADEKTVQYTTKTTQFLTAPEGAPLYYMLMVRWEKRWRFALLSRDDLVELRRQAEAKERQGGGAPFKTINPASKNVSWHTKWTKTGAEIWGIDISRFVDQFPPGLPDITAQVEPPEADDEEGDAESGEGGKVQEKPAEEAIGSNVKAK